MLGYFVGKKGWVKGVIVLMVFLLLLPLAGCNRDAAVLKEVYMKGREIESSRGISTVSVANRVPKEQLSPEAQMVFALLEKGLTMETAVADLDSMETVLTPGDVDALRKAGIWPYDEDPSLSFFMNQGKIGMKTSADQRYLVLDLADAGLLEPESDADYSSFYQDSYADQMELAWKFIGDFVKGFNYSLPRVEQLGRVELELPDGTVETKGLKIEMDFEEALDFTIYSLKHLTGDEAFKEYMIESMRRPMERMLESGAIPPEELPSEEEMQSTIEMPYQEFQKMLDQALESLEALTPAELKEQYGLELSLTVEYYLDDEGFIRKTRGVYNIKAEDEALESIFGTPLLDLTINTEQLVWDINKPVEIVFPPEEEQVSFFALMADPELKEKLAGGPLSLLSDFFQNSGLFPGDGASLVLDLENNLSILNGVQVELEPFPYFEGDTFMVPFRALAELTGGEVFWVPETKQVRYRGEGLEMEFTVDGNQALVNGEMVELAANIVIRKDRAMVPVGLIEKLAKQCFVQEGQMAVFVF